MCAINTSDKVKTINFSDYAERTAGFANAVNVLDGTSHSTSSAITIDSLQTLVLELKK